MKKRERARRRPPARSRAVRSRLRAGGSLPSFPRRARPRSGALPQSLTCQIERASESGDQDTPASPDGLPVSHGPPSLFLPRPLSRAGRRRCLSRPCGRPGRAGSGGGRPAGGPGRWRGTAWRTREQREGRDGMSECARAALLRPKTKKRATDGARGRLLPSLACRTSTAPARVPPSV
jgi:hypothetical protein